MEAGRNVKERGLENNLLELIAADPAFNLSPEDLQKAMKPELYTGCAKEQTEEFINETVLPLLEANRELLGMTSVINV